MSDSRRDPGLQPERTALAWQRTLLSASGVALVIGVAAVRLESPVVAVVAAVVAAASAGLLASRSRGTWHSVRRASWTVVTLALAGAGLALHVALTR